MHRSFIEMLEIPSGNAGKRGIVMEKPFKIEISNGLTAPAIRVREPKELSAAMGELGLESPRPILVVVGGASKMSEADLNRVRSLFEKVLAPLVEELGAFVVDGGTDAGVMQMIGQARARIGATFSLIGVTPVGKVALPNSIPSEEDTGLEPNHTHFVLIPGSNWGDESSWMVSVASVLAGGAPSLAVLVNGGEISKKDVAENLKANRPVLAIAGSGRLADRIAAALRGEETEELVRELVASGLVRAIDMNESFDRLSRVIKEMFDAGKGYSDSQISVI